MLPESIPVDGDIEDFALPAGSTAMTRSVFDPLPEESAHCDVLYAEPAWRAGYAKFNSRAGFAQLPPSRSYESYLAALRTLVQSFSPNPSFMCIGKSMAKRLSPHWTVPTSLHCGNALIAGWNCGRQSVPHSISNSVELIDHLATKFNFVYDPCCGYGNACVAFFLAGKRFLGCDINRKCIGVLASRVGFSPPQQPANGTPTP